MSIERLDKYISNNYCHSRKDATKIIHSGFVKIDDIICKDPSTKINTSKQTVFVKGVPISSQKNMYIKINKPSGILCVSRDPNVKTIVDLLPEEYQKINLFPAGRLDKTSTGLVLLTNDGQWSHKIISPKNHVMKSYEVQLDAPINPSIIDDFLNGVTLADGYRCMPAILTAISADFTRVSVSIHEGKYHQIKRMFGVFQIGVNQLHRTSIGKVSLEGIEKNESFKFLTNEEANSLVE